MLFAVLTCWRSRHAQALHARAHAPDVRLDDRGIEHEAGRFQRGERNRRFRLRIHRAIIPEPALEAVQHRQTSRAETIVLAWISTESAMFRA